MTTKAYVTLTLVEQVEIDVDSLVEEFGPKARTQKFLKEWAVGNRDSSGMVIDSTFDTMVEPPKRKVIRKTYS